MGFFDVFDSKLRAQKKAEQEEETRQDYQTLRHNLGMTPFTFEGDITTSEIWWRDHFLWLKDLGYQLRSRYAPGLDKDWYKCEDRLWLLPQINSAVRASDGAHVILKRIQPSIHPHEIEIGRFLTSEPLRSQHENHCVEMLDIIPVPNDTDQVLIVLPLLRAFNDPPFETIGEIIDFCCQAFEGLQFMHKYHVAHRDCMDLNIMMDASEMYPEPFHPCEPDMRFDMKDSVKHFSRTERPPRYLFIDFGISRRYEMLDHAPLEPPILGGFALQKELINVYRGLEFLQPLVSDMLQSDPAQRPTMDEVASRFVPTYNALSPWKLRSRAVLKDEWMFVGLFRSFIHWLRSLRYIWRRLPAIPSRMRP
ncbi:uncharacterized protein EDB91DRAFT_1165051 [Suillus paluster]|uniref:uncharacterized protein n=1 Tax=Suillus paluster TaxID=48578 RepID=UPI001B877711|nr:uncharacterized protein EDB91DRAFT_1165051 [Suillus paluster]KAG1726947.1 hypothetical protein EDB91DRAFT_1165051 [Suillus paluster]